MTRCLVTAQTDSPRSQPAHDAPRSSPRSPMGTRSATGGGGSCSDSGGKPMRDERVEPAEPLANRSAVRRLSGRSQGGRAESGGRAAPAKHCGPGRSGPLPRRSVWGAGPGPGEACGEPARAGRSVGGRGCQCRGCTARQGTQCLSAVFRQYSPTCSTASCSSSAEAVWGMILCRRSVRSRTPPRVTARLFLVGEQEDATERSTECS